MSSPPLVVQRRGACVESKHPFSVALQPHIGPAELIGPDLETTWRSAAKPFQLASNLELLGDPDVPEDELAVGAASHSAEPQHVAIVRRILDRFGRRAEDLRCGTHPPAHTPSAEALLRAGGEFSPIHNNCSGKHAFMLSAAAHLGLDLDYRPADHGVQRRAFERIATWTGTTPALAVDGCGVPTFCLPLSGIARAWGLLARAMTTGRDPRLGRVGRAMAARPDLTSGTDRFDLLLARASTEPIAVKIGAQGVFCVALPGRALGLAVKVHSGVSEALPAAVLFALERYASGAIVLPEDFGPLLVRNVAGRVVGDLRVEAP